MNEDLSSRGCLTCSCTFSSGCSEERRAAEVMERRRNRSRTDGSRPRSTPQSAAARREVTA